MKRTIVVLLSLWVANFAYARVPLPGGVQLLCHRTANEDVPENTLESLEQAALLGCDVVEIDLRRTLDGKIVLNHDGILERLTDGVGDVETSYYDDLERLDVGSWMGVRSKGLHMVLFEDALRLAREQDIRLVLDMKTKGMGPDVLQILQREGMLKRVQFNGEWDDVKQLYPEATDVGNDTAWVQPGVTAEQVNAYHREGKAVVANFSANVYEMDVTAMKGAVAAGVDGINVDFPRLGADAVGRPIERKVDALAAKANAGESRSRSDAILELSRYRGFPLQEEFVHWLLDPDDNVSRAAATALVEARPPTPTSAFAEALLSEHMDARANAAWALGEIKASAANLFPLLRDKDPQVLQAALLALARCPGDASANLLLPLLSYDDSSVRGAAAIALAQHQPEVAVKAVPAQLQLEMAAEQKMEEDHVKSGAPRFTQLEINVIIRSFRCQMEMIRAIGALKGSDVTRELEALALRSGKGASQPEEAVAGFQLWDRIEADPSPVIQALGSSDGQVADRAEWILVKAGPTVLPKVRNALHSSSMVVRERAIRIVAWQGDIDSLDTLQALQAIHGADADLSAWAIAKIESLHPNL